MPNKEFVFTFAVCVNHTQKTRAQRVEWAINELMEVRIFVYIFSVHQYIYLLFVSAYALVKSLSICVGLRMVCVFVCAFVHFG